MQNIQNYKNDIITNDIFLTSVKENYVWNTLNSFHVTEKFLGDIMHDLFLGVCNYEISVIFYKMIVDFKNYLRTTAPTITCRI